MNEYLDIQNIVTESEVINPTDVTDLTSYFGRRKQPMYVTCPHLTVFKNACFSKKKTLFKFDSSSSALTLSSTLKTNKKDKALVCKPHANNILVVFIPFMSFVSDIEQEEGVTKSCQLNKFLTQYVYDIYLKKKSEEVIDQIDVAVRSADAWKATVLLDCTADYKPLLIV